MEDFAGAEVFQMEDFRGQKPFQMEDFAVMGRREPFQMEMKVLQMEDFRSLEAAWL